MDCRQNRAHATVTLKNALIQHNPSPSEIKIYIFIPFSKFGVNSLKLSTIFFRGEFTLRMVENLPIRTCQSSAPSCPSTHPYSFTAKLLRLPLHPAPHSSVRTFAKHNWKVTALAVYLPLLPLQGRGKTPSPKNH